MIVTPFWKESDATKLLASDLTVALASNDAPWTPHKFGFAIDTGPTPVLQDAPADIRIEKDVSGGLILVADGAGVGKPVTIENCLAESIALAAWFLDKRDDEGRMAALLQSGHPLPDSHSTQRQIQTYAPKPGATPAGTMVALTYGQMKASKLAKLAGYGGLRITPWRMLLVDNPDLPTIGGFISDPSDPLLRVVTCAGTQGCGQGRINTRALAGALSARLKPHHKLHLSGCPKGCAHPKPSTLTVVGSSDGLSLIHNGRASDTPTQSGLTVDQLIKAI